MQQSILPDSSSAAASGHAPPAHPDLFRHGHHLAHLGHGGHGLGLRGAEAAFDRSPFSSPPVSPADIRVKAEHPHSQLHLLAKQHLSPFESLPDTKGEFVSKWRADDNFRII
jgi:hypothetical protein